MKDFRDLIIWQRAHRLFLSIYSDTKQFPKDEIYGLTSQIRRSCISIPPNIAEGCGKQSDQDFARYLYIAMGSASELEYELMLAHDLNYLDSKQYSDLNSELDEIRKMLNAFLKRLAFR